MGERSGYRTGSGELIAPFDLSVQDKRSQYENVGADLSVPLWVSGHPPHIIIWRPFIWKKKQGLMSGSPHGGEASVWGNRLTQRFTNI